MLSSLPRVRAVCVVALLSHAALFATAAELKLPLTDQLPADTTTYLYRMSWEETRKAQAETAGGKSLSDPAIGAFLADFERVVDEAGKSEPWLALAYRGLLQEIVIAGTDATEAAPPPRDTATPDADGDMPASPPPAARAAQFAVLRPAAADAAKLRELLNKTVQEWDGSITRHTAAGVEWDVLGENNCFLTWQDNALICALGEKGAQLARAEKPAKTLAGEAQFQAVTSALAKDMKGTPTALYYYDFRGMWENSETPGAVLDKMSWRSVDAMSGATFVAGDHFRNRHYWKLNSKRTGLFAHTRTARLNEEWLKRIPADATEFVTGVMDAESLAYTFGALASRASEPGEAQPNPATLIPPAVQGMLRNIGPRYMVYRRPRVYSAFFYQSLLPTTDLVIALELRDAAAFKESLGSALELAGDAAPFTKWKHGEQEVSSFPLYYFGSLHFAITDSEVLITTGTQLMKDALDNWKTPGPALTATPEFAKVKSQVPAEACFLLYFPAGGFERGVMDTYLPQLEGYLGMMRLFSSFDSDGVEDETPMLRAELMPRGSDLARYAKTPTFLAATDTGDAIMFDGAAPVLTTPYYWVALHAVTHLMPETDFLPLGLFYNW